VSGQLHASVALFQDDDPSVPLNKWLNGHQKQSGPFGVEIQTLTTSGIDIKFRGRPAINLFTKQARQSRKNGNNTKYTKISNICSNYNYHDHHHDNYDHHHYYYEPKFLLEKSQL
jgi:hypothetical protein